MPRALTQGGESRAPDGDGGNVGGEGGGGDGGGSEGGGEGGDGERLRTAWCGGKGKGGGEGEGGGESSDGDGSDRGGNAMVQAAA